MDKIKQLFNRIRAIFEEKKETEPQAAGQSLSKQNKVALVISGISLLFIVFSFFNKTPASRPVQTVTNQVSSKERTEAGRAEKNEQSIPPKKQMEKPQAQASDSFQNPFIDLAVLHSTVLPNGMEVPAIPVNSVPVPNVGTVPIPNIPDIPPAGSQGKEAVKVKGIASSSGKTIAIMSDGTVLSEGQSFADDRVAYIGGDGVTFDNGKHLEYKK